MLEPGGGLFVRDYCARGPVSTIMRTPPRPELNRVLCVRLAPDVPQRVRLDSLTLWLAEIYRTGSG